MACKLLVAACMWDLVPRPGIEPGPPALGAWSLIHCFHRGSPCLLVFVCFFVIDKMAHSTMAVHILYKTDPGSSPGSALTSSVTLGQSLNTLRPSFLRIVPTDLTGLS